jgi:hypothetical protein
VGMMTEQFSSSPKEAGAKRATDKRTAYYRRQAAECELAGTTANLGEIREAYLNIEQAWLQLAAPDDRARLPLFSWRPPLKSARM